MSDHDDAWRRFREREDEAEAQKTRSRPEQAPISGKKAIQNAVAESLATQLTPLLEQLNGLYQQYFAGVEKRAPIEKRAQAERMVQMLSQQSQMGAALKFRCQALIQQYRTYAERWDRVLKQKGL